MSSSLTEQAADQLRKVLFEQQLTITGAAKQTGTHNRTCQRILSGHTSPTMSTYERIMNELGYELVLEARPII